MDAGEEVTLTFRGKFTKIANHTFDISINRANFDNYTDFKIVEIKKLNPGPDPTPIPKPEPFNVSSAKYKHKGGNVTNVVMAKTGPPIIVLILLVFFCLFA